MADDLGVILSLVCLSGASVKQKIDQRKAP